MVKGYLITFVHEQEQLSKNVLCLGFDLGPSRIKVQRPYPLGHKGLYTIDGLKL